MASELDSLADALVAHLLAQSGTPWPAVKKYCFEMDLAGDITTLKCTVIPGGIPQLAQSTRGRREMTYRVLVALQKRITGDEAAVDAAMPALLESAEALVMALPYGQSLTVGARQARLVAIENVPAYDPDHLEQNNQFTSIITTDWQVLR